MYRQSVQAVGKTAVSSPEGLNGMMKKPTLSRMCIHANIAKVISAFVWEQGACSTVYGLQAHVVLGKMHNVMCLAKIPNDSIIGMKY